MMDSMKKAVAAILEYVLERSLTNYYNPNEDYKLVTSDEEIGTSGLYNIEVYVDNKFAFSTQKDILTIHLIDAYNYIVYGKAHKC